MSLAVTTRKFTVDEYHAMIRWGILQEDDRVELLSGGDRGNESNQ
ncbi:MAG: hypothetical protein Q9P14_07495 [candidate division KSB1 bacterium]|nr:hypothetical protein [candidate division KSB1 bacterium]